MNKRRTSAMTAILAIVVIILLIVAGIQVSEEIFEGVELDGIEREFRVDLNKIAIKELNMSNLFIDSSMPGRANDRLWTDAVSTPFDCQDDADGAFDEVILEIAGNPVFLDMVIRGTKDLSVTNRRTLGDLNPWMSEFVAKMDSAMKRPAYDAKGNHIVHGNEAWLFEDEAKKVRVTPEYQRYAAGMSLLLKRLKVIDIESRTSKENWVLPLISDPGYTRTELADYQEDKPALILGYLQKNDTWRWIIGFNMGDRRLEIFPPDDSPDNPTSPPTNPPSRPTNPPVNPTDPPSNPTPVPTPTPTAKPTPRPTKDSSRHPGDQGDAPDGAGDGGPTTAEEYKPDPPEPPEEYVPPVVVGDGENPVQGEQPSGGGTQHNADPPPANPLPNPDNNGDMGLGDGYLAEPG